MSLLVKPRLSHYASQQSVDNRLRVRPVKLHTVRLPTAKSLTLTGTPK